MEGYLSDEEQLERLKKWWKDNSRSVVIGIIAGLILVFGWQYWKQRQMNRQEHASLLYMQLLEANTNSDADNKTRQVALKQLKTTYARSTYAGLAMLLSARIAVEKQQWNVAQTQLTWVIDHSRDAVLQHVARLRLARILAAQKQYDAALAQLDKAGLASFRGLTEEIRGDVYRAQGQPAKARQAYQAALQANGSVRRLHPWLPLKLSAVNGSVI